MCASSAFLPSILLGLGLGASLPSPRTVAAEPEAEAAPPPGCPVRGGGGSSLFARREWAILVSAGILDAGRRRQGGGPVEIVGAGGEP